MASRNKSQRNRVHTVLDVRPGWHQRQWSQTLLAFWRWLPEFITATILFAAFAAIHLHVQPHPWWVSALILTAPLGVLLLITPVRRQAVAWFWVNYTRHRLRSFMAENNIRNNSGRLPWLLSIHPTKTGERAYMVVPAGISVEDIDNELDSLGPTCAAISGKAQACKHWTNIIQIDIKRRDLLEATTKVVSELDTRPDGSILQPTAIEHTGSDWAKEAGLVDAPDHDTEPAATRVRAVGNKPTKTTPFKEADVVTSNGEDISAYV